LKRLVLTKNSLLTDWFFGAIHRIVSVKQAVMFGAIANG